MIKGTDTNRNSNFSRYKTTPVTDHCSNSSKSRSDPGNNNNNKNNKDLFLYLTSKSNKITTDQISFINGKPFTYLTNAQEKRSILTKTSITIIMTIVIITIITTTAANTTHSDTHFPSRV